MEARLVVAVVVLLCTFGGFTEAQTQISLPISTNITQTGCGSTKLCMPSVSGCDPSGNSTCFFSSTQLNNTILTVELSGTTLGYVALGLTPTTSLIQQALGLNNVVLVCGNNNNTSLFYQASSLQNGTFQTVSVPNGTISSVQGSILTNTTIQCIFNFNITNLYQLFSSGSTVQLPFNVNILNGTTNGTQLGTPNTVFNSNGTLDLANPKSTVQTVNITRNGCGTTKLCMSSVSGCDPSGNSTCFFSSTQLNNTILTVELSGTTLGYVALGLTPTTSQILQFLGLNNVVLACGNNNNSLFYQTTSLQSGTLQTSVSVPNGTIFTVQGSILTNTAIQCIFNFNITNLYQLFPSGSAVQLPFNVTILNGTTNGTQLGTPNTVFNSNGPLDLANPKSTVPTPAPSTLNITRTGCGTTKLCMSSVNGCDPSGNSSCFFSSTQLNNTILTVELSGTTLGYVALGLTPTTSQIQQFLGLNNVVLACRNYYNYSVFYQATSLQSGTLQTSVSVPNISISNFQGSILTNTAIQCIFNFNIPNLYQLFPSGSAVQLPFNVTILNGTTNGTQLGTPNTVFNSNGPLDLANPKSTVPTPAPSTPSTINITRTGCGTTKLCLSNSSTCDPSGNSSCFFTSFQVVNQNFSFELSGMTSGYIALALIKPPSTQAFVFVCGNNASVNSSNFFFVTATKSGTSLNVTTVNTVYSVQGIVANSQTLIQCLFNTSTTFAVSTKSDTTTYQALIMSGTTNGTNLGDPTVRADTVVAIDLSNVTALNTTPNSANAISSFCTKVFALLISALTLRLV